MKCTHCGKDFADGTKFCPFCGENVAARTAPQQPVEANKPAVCAGCGALIEPGMKFCPKCGAPAETAQKPKAKASSNKKWFIIGGCALAAIIAAVVLIVVLAGGRSVKGGASSPEELAELMYKYANSKDSKGYFSLFCDPILRAYGDFPVGTSRDDMIEELAAEYRGGVYFEIYSSAKYKVVVAETGLECPAYKLDYFTVEERDSVEDYAIVTVTYEIIENGQSTIEYTSFNCIKMNGKWFLIYVV